MKKILFVLATIATLLSAYLTWENYQLLKQKVYWEGMAEKYRFERDSLHIEMRWAMSAIDGSPSARAHFQRRD